MLITICSEPRRDLMWKNSASKIYSINYIILETVWSQYKKRRAKQEGTYQSCKLLSAADKPWITLVIAFLFPFLLILFLISSSRPCRLSQDFTSLHPLRQAIALCPGFPLPVHKTREKTPSKGRKMKSKNGNKFKSLLEGRQCGGGGGGGGGCICQGMLGAHRTHSRKRNASAVGSVLVTLTFNEIGRVSKTCLDRAWNGQSGLSLTGLLGRQQRALLTDEALTARPVYACS